MRCGIPPARNVRIVLERALTGIEKGLQREGRTSSNGNRRIPCRGICRAGQIRTYRRAAFEHGDQQLIIVEVDAEIDKIAKRASAERGNRCPIVVELAIIETKTPAVRIFSDVFVRRRAGIHDADIYRTERAVRQRPRAPCQRLELADCVG